MARLFWPVTDVPATPQRAWESLAVVQALDDPL
jgi:hypothetical protein